MEKLVGKDKPLLEQISILKEILKMNQNLWKILEKLDENPLPNYYVVAGSVNQTVFNYYHDYPLDYGCSDIDIVYFDEDLSYEKENEWIEKTKAVLSDFPYQVDIKNEARVHLWYEEKFGFPLKAPYVSVEDAIRSWGFTVTSLGVRLEKGKLIVFAPYGLNDLFNLLLRPVKDTYSDRSYYDLKVSKWTKKWKDLKVLPYE